MMRVMHGRPAPNGLWRARNGAYSLGMSRKTSTGMMISGPAA
jgi:hypothetical protein